MKTKLLKAFSLLLAMSLLIISSGFTTVASNPALEASGASVALDGKTAKTVTVSLVTTDIVECYGIEGTWSVHEQGSKYFTLDSISSEVLTFGETDFVDIRNGKVLWVDDSYDADKYTLAKDVKLLTATYEVAADTPEGDYTVQFTSEVFTGAGDPDETVVVYTATIKVTHVCTPVLQAGEKPTCEENGWEDYYYCATCETYYEDAEGTTKIPNIEIWKKSGGKIAAIEHDWTKNEPTYTDNGDGTHTMTQVCGNDATHTQSANYPHTYKNGKCVCGADEPVVGLKGDVNLDGDVDINDLVALAKHVGEVEAIEDDTAIYNADVNNDDEIDINDLVKLAQYVGEVIDSLD